VYFHAGGLTNVQVLSSIVDPGAANGANITPDVPTALYLFRDAGATEIIVGSDSGEVRGATSAWSGDDTTNFTGQINGIVYSPTHDRVVAVADNGELGYWDATDKATNNSFNLVSSGFAITTRIMAVDWNATDGIFIAVAKNGQICRSTNGTN
jgi:WD40 repeat protein